VPGRMSAKGAGLARAMSRYGSGAAVPFEALPWAHTPGARVFVDDRLEAGPESRTNSDRYADGPGVLT